MKIDTRVALGIRPELRPILDQLKALEPTPGETMSIIAELQVFQKFGRYGGLKLKRQRGRGYYKRIGKLGGRPPKKRKKR